MSNSTANGTAAATDVTSTLDVVLNALIFVFLAVVMIGMGCGVELDKMKRHLKRPTGVAVGIVAQFGKLLSGGGGAKFTVTSIEV